MSLDVTITYKKPKIVNYANTHSACGSNMRIVDDDYECEETEWNANITHNMTEMAHKVPTHYHVGNNTLYNTLYAVVWRPEEYGISNTNIIAEALVHGIAYMVEHRKELLKYNPDNGWGDYDSFLQWLIVYKEQCEDNPDCEISTSR